jgi:hypothetical protein
MNVGPLIAAGCLAVVGAGVHGIGGELLIVRKLPPDALWRSPFGGRRTLAMIHVTWHLTTFAFFAVGLTLLLSGTVLDGDAAHGIAVAGAAAATGFAAIVVGLGAADTRSPHSLVRHPGPLVLTATAALAWWGAA